jgi:PAS domain S-box-containing protein
MGQNIVNRIAYKLVLWLILFISILAILGTFVQLYLDYHDDFKRVRGAIENAALNLIPHINQDLETGAPGALVTTLDNLLTSGDLAYVAVVVGDQVVLQRGKKLQSINVYTRFPLVTASDKVHESETAVLEIMADMGAIWQENTTRFIQLLLVNSIKIFFIAGFVLLMFQYMVTRHLEALAGQVRDLDFTTPYSPVQLERKGSDKQDELDQVVCGLNSMYQRAHDAYENLTKNKQRLLLFFDSTEESIIGVDRDGSCTFANDACLHLLGLTTCEEIINKKIRELFVCSDGRQNGELTGDCLVFQSIKKASALQCDDARVTVVGGEILLAAVRCYPVFENGEVSGAIVFMTDNREKRQLLRERELLSEAVKQVPVMIIIADKANRIEFINPSAERLTGFDREELLGRSVLNFQDMVIDGITRYGQIKGALKSGRQWEGVIEARTRWGAVVQFYSVISPVFDERGAISSYISVSREISYEVALQNELVNAKKMEAVGRLSANFAHEFGNPLFGVRSVLKDFCERDDFSREDTRLFELAHHECERMRVMVREFQQLYHDSSGGEGIEKLNDIVAKILHRASPRMKAYNIACSLDMNTGNCALMVSRNKLFLVLRNIITNAIEAMAQTGGRLQVSDRNEGCSLVVSILDEGKGIEEKNQELIFEPFFSTKPEIEGAGLGLSVAYGTMKSMGGTITFVSKPGKGALFEVHIPLC